MMKQNHKKFRLNRSNKLFESGNAHTRFVAIAPEVIFWTPMHMKRLFQNDSKFLLGHLKMLYFAMNVSK